MILGSTVGAVGIGLLTTLNINTPTVKWASYLVLSGIGIGTGINIPFTAVQVALEFVPRQSVIIDCASADTYTSKCDIPIGNAVTLFFMQLGGALSLPIANAAFVDGLRSALIKQTKAISPQAAIRAGPTNLRSLTDNKDVLFALRMSYLQAVKNSFYLALGAVASAVIFGACMEWRRMDLGETKRGSEIDTVNEQQDHV
ncbi:MAG: hypothetical protein M1835_004315 [Candelina submexicana]|nr:MAG: hypothetical protein M1835_004315 [Candelina submexicana]